MEYPNLKGIAFCVVAPATLGASGAIFTNYLASLVSSAALPTLWAIGLSAAGCAIGGAAFLMLVENSASSGPTPSQSGAGIGLASITSVLLGAHQGFAGASLAVAGLLPIAGIVSGTGLLLLGALVAEDVFGIDLA